MKKLIIILFLLSFACIPLYGQTKYTLPIDVESSNGIPIKNGNVDLYQSGVFVADLTWLSAGRYYYTSDDTATVQPGVYDIYLGGRSYATGIWLGNYGVTAQAASWQSDISDTVDYLGAVYEINLYSNYIMAGAEEGDSVATLHSLTDTSTVYTTKLILYYWSSIYDSTMTFYFIGTVDGLGEDMTVKVANWDPSGVTATYTGTKNITSNTPGNLDSVSFNIDEETTSVFYTVIISIKVGTSGDTGNLTPISLSVLRRRNVSRNITE